MPIFFSSSYFGASSVQVSRSSEISATGKNGRKNNTNEETFIELCQREHNRYDSFKRSKIFFTAERTLQDEYITLSECFTKAFSKWSEIKSVKPKKIISDAVPLAVSLWIIFALI